VIIEQGDIGQEFFLIVSGQCDVFSNDTFIETLPAGEFFGEAALLKNVTRSATVRAKGEASVLVLHKQDFLKMVNSHRLQLIFGRRKAIGRLGNQFDGGISQQISPESKKYAAAVKAHIEKDSRTEDLLSKAICQIDFFNHLDSQQCSAIVQVNNVMFKID
jgi:CRP-like cAMP-binding protein